MNVCEQCSAVLEREGERCTRCGHAPGDPPDEMVGRELLGRYRIVRVIAEGGMGRVYLATQAVGTALRQVAIKVLRRQLSMDPQLATRFAREAETLVRLTHPNTVQVFDFGSLPDGTLALVMEYVKGHSLANELGKGPLPLARVKRILNQIGGALKEAHAHGIVHRDLKPDNVLIADREGQADFVKVLDFGIASVSEIDQATRTRLTQQGMMVGTPPYMSPEQFSGERVDPRSDVYSLALIAYELLSGRLPFDAKTPWEWASKHMTQPPAPLTPTRDGRIGSAQVRAIHRALAKKADERPGDVDMFLREFMGEATSSPALASASIDPGRDRDSLEPTPGLRSSRRIDVMAGVIALLLVLALLTARALWPDAETASAANEEARQRTAGPPAAPALGPSIARAPDPLPTGAIVPEGREAPEPSARHAKHREGGRARSKEPIRAHAASTATIGQAQVEPSGEAQVPTPPAAERPVSQVVPSPPRAAAPISQPPQRAESAPAQRPPSGRAPALSVIPPDLEQRLTRIHEAASKRPELAVGLYQAAASRYGGHPALASMRELLRKNGRDRVVALRQQNLCPQAQALQRALASIQAASPPAQLFDGACPAP